MRVSTLAPGIEVSRIGLGTVKLGRNQGVKYPRAFDLPSMADARVLIATARELGINLIDTAPAYGLAEARVGELLKSQRQDWIVGTKVGEDFDGASHFDFSLAGAQSSLHRSFQRLNTDYLDYVLLHSDGDDSAVLNSGACEALVHARREGSVRAIGISSKTLDGALMALDMGLDIVMVTLNSETTGERPACIQAAARGRGVLIKKALGSGHLNPADSLTFVDQTPGVTSIISGTLNPDHLRANVALINQKEAPHA